MHNADQHTPPNPPSATDHACDHAPAAETAPEPHRGAHPLHEANRLSWNAATRAHNTHKPNQAAFLRAGGSTLFSEERELLGDVRGKRVLHLLCNSGQDSLSIAARGADVTGVDISDEAIATAQRLSDESGITATFHRADVYPWLADAAERDPRWDLAFFSYGALCWLSDIAGFFERVATVLAPGGRVVGIDFHPAGLMFDENWDLAYPYSTAGEPLLDDRGVSDYVAEAGEALAAGEFANHDEVFTNPHPDYEYLWSIGDVLGALLAADLRLAHFAEYPYSNGAKIWNEMELGDDRRWRLPAGSIYIPLMFSVVAQRD